MTNFVHNVDRIYKRIEVYEQEKVMKEKWNPMEKKIGPIVIEIE